jgi:hypothetical protein
MKLKNLFIINTLVAVIFGLAFVLLPETTSSLYDITLSPGGLLLAQLFGTSLVGFAVLTWFARNAGESEARNAIILAMVISDTIGFVVSLLAQLSGVTNALGWSTVAIYLLLTLGFGYFQFKKPSTT